MHCAEETLCEGQACALCREQVKPQMSLFIPAAAPTQDEFSLAHQQMQSFLEDSK